MSIGTKLLTAIKSGIPWTLSNTTLPIENDWESIICGNGRFVALSTPQATGTSQTVYSNDGINWQVGTINHVPGTPSRKSGIWSTIAFGSLSGGVYVGASYGQSTRDAGIVYSLDGINWQCIDVPGFQQQFQTTWGPFVTSITYGNERFVAVEGADVSGGFGSRRAGLSYDGISWSWSSRMPGRKWWNSVTYGNGRFVAVSDTDGDNIWAYSNDGNTWTNTGIIPISINPVDFNRFGTTSIAYGSDKFIAVGRAYVSSKDAFELIALYSSDGISWFTLQHDIPYSAGSAGGTWEPLPVIIYGNGYFLIFFPNKNEAYYSSDGNTWYRSILNSRYTRSICAVGDNRFVAPGGIVGGSLFTPTIEYLDIPAPSKWVSGNMPAGNWRSVTYGVINGRGMFVAIPWGEPGVTARSAYSYDGITWSTSLLPVGTGGATLLWRDITYNTVLAVGSPLLWAGRFVAIAQNSTTSVYSDDGITWQTDTIGGLASGPLWSITPYNNTGASPASLSRDRFQLIGGGGAISNIYQTSRSGISWNSYAVTHLWRSLAFGRPSTGIHNNRFLTVAVANSNTASYQIWPVLTWATTPYVANEVSSVTYGNGTFVSVGASVTGGLNRSTDGLTWSSPATPLIAQWMDITYGNGRFVAVGFNTDVAMYSDNGGVTWNTDSVLPSSNNWESITYGNGRFVAVGLSKNAVLSW